MTLATGAAAPAGSGTFTLLLLALPILLLLFLMFTQRRRTKALGEAQQALQVGQEVMTTAGMHGVITGLEHEVVHLRIADGVVVRYDRRAIIPMSMAATGRPGATGRPAQDGTVPPGQAGQDGTVQPGYQDPGTPGQRPPVDGEGPAR